MPKYNYDSGIEILPGDACKTCSIIDQCNVYTDLVLDKGESKWNGTHIVQVGDIPPTNAMNPGDKYIECKSYSEYISPASKAKIDPDFGKNTQRYT